MDKVPQNQELDKQFIPKPIVSHAPKIVKHRQQLKKALTYHLAGIGVGKGLLCKTLERASEWLDSGEDTKVGKAMETVIKLLPYALEREGQATLIPGLNGASTINVQINNFDSFIKQKLSKTNLGQLLTQTIQEAEVVETQEAQDLTPPPTPGAA